MKVGIILAVEIGALLDFYNDVKEVKTNTTYHLYKVKRDNNDIYILQTGMGMVAASSGVQYLISHWHVEIIVNFGVVGGLTKEMKNEKLCVIDRVVHYRYDVSELLPLQIGQVASRDSIFLNCSEYLVEKAQDICPGLVRATCCSGDRFVGNEKDKKYLHTTFEGDVCDMESAGILLTCDANHIPCLFLKAVSDGLSDGAQSFFELLKIAATKALEVADKIIKEFIK